MRTSHAQRWPWREAAAACSTIHTTIRRREAGDLPNSVQDRGPGRTVPGNEI
ncbi:hypothetical protein [Streptomyces sp. NPDC057686]|uniref:hypothetical protein n=1 Tax=Streptomyces sp. NPDC057686 TaxID=3346212 RepID=UPI0036A8FD30